MIGQVSLSRIEKRMALSCMARAEDRGWDAPENF